MKRWLIVTLLCLLSLPALGAEVGIPELASRVTDLTNTLSTEQRAALEAKLQAFESEKGSQIAVLLLPSTQPETIEQYSIRVVEHWKLGRKKVDDGVLLLIAKDDRKIRIEVGYGLEGTLTDLISKRIIEEEIAPHFKQGNFFSGIEAGINRIFGILQGETLPAPQAPQTSDDASHYYLFLILLSFISGRILRSTFGTLPGAVMNGGGIGFLSILLGAGTTLAISFGFVAFIFALINRGKEIRFNGRSTGGFSGRGGSFSSGGGFSGGGGGFGGGGSSGSW